MTPTDRDRYVEMLKEVFNLNDKEEMRTKVINVTKTFLLVLFFVYVLLSPFITLAINSYINE